MTKPQEAPVRIISVLWGDAWSSSSPYNAEELKEEHQPTYITSVGVEVINDKTGITLVGEVFHDDNKFNRYRKPQFIPRKGIISITVLKS